MGSHAWPTLNSALITFVPDQAVDGILRSLKELDESAPKQGLRAFVLDAEERSV
ncbi:MAG: PG0541 family transporter-associated protein [Bacteroidales bacterium]